MLNDQNAKWLISIPKIRVSDDVHRFVPGTKLIVDLKSEQAPAEQFILDMQGHIIKLSKVSIQARVRRSVGLVRLDLNGPPHVNPDGVMVKCPHVHIYREGYDLKWAYPVPSHIQGREFKVSPNIFQNLEEFFSFCNIVEPPLIQGGLFGI